MPNSPMAMTSIGFGPQVVDFNGDGSVTFYRNTGTKKEPRLAEGQVLISAGGWDGDGSPSGVPTKVCVTDAL